MRRPGRSGKARDVNNRTQNRKLALTLERSGGAAGFLNFNRAVVWARLSQPGRRGRQTARASPPPQPRASKGAIRRRSNIIRVKPGIRPRACAASLFRLLGNRSHHKAWATAANRRGRRLTQLAGGAGMQLDSCWSGLRRGPGLPSSTTNCAQLAA